MDGISFAQDVVFGDAWIIVNANGDLIINPQNYTPQPGDVVLSVGEGELVNPSPQEIASEISVSVVEADGSINSVDVSDRVQEAVDINDQDGDEPQSEDRDEALA
ncbi:hypothetical protein JCM19236_483 [Vibrio sp. JCM 19236]|nr:hypothetical protein JCM19236_483 [Vibrio sp. JCM 19236]